MCALTRERDFTAFSGTKQKLNKRITKMSLKTSAIKQSALSTQFDTDHCDLPQ